MDAAVIARTVLRAIDGGSQIRHRVDQGAVQVEHHQTRQAPIEQLLDHARTWASSARMASITVL